MKANQQSNYTKNFKKEIISSPLTNSMPLNRLCFVLPADLDEIEVFNSPRKQPFTPPPSSQNPHHHNHRLRRFLRRITPCRPKDFSKSFQDIPGAIISSKPLCNTPRIFNYTELYIGSNGFSDAEILGAGGFGRVYKAKLPSDGTLVAVKCMTEKRISFEKSFVAELMAVASLRHRNLVRLRGWCIHEEQLLLVYDYMPHRSLDHILFKKPGEKEKKYVLSFDQRWRIVSGLAAALFYLHEQLETQIIHRDVKTSNVMLDMNYNARLGDFGLARWLEHEVQFPSPLMVSGKGHRFRLDETTRIGGTMGYLPPENFQKRGMSTAKSDVFSFGIVALEVVSGRRVVDLTYPDEQIMLLDWVRMLSDEGQFLQVGDRRLVEGSYQNSDMKRLIHLGLLCSVNDPKMRPTMKWVVEALSGNIIGELPALPVFNLQPFYISLSSGTTTTSTTSKITSSTMDSATSTGYITADNDTVYLTADDGNSSNYLNRPITFHSVNTPQEITYKDLLAATDNFSQDRRIAEVDFGTAYSGTLNNNQHILVKRLGMKTCPALRSRFADELHNLKQLRHRNLVQLKGWCTEQGEMLVVYDYLPSHQLSHLLFHHRDTHHPVLQWHHRYNIVKSLASAITYLHEEWDDQVIHRNITSAAIYLDADMNPRLGSFALAEFLTRNEDGHHININPNSAVRGIFGYMAPEYIETGEANPRTDIYSFGVVILEVVSCRRAVDFQRPEVLLVKKVREFETQKKPVTALVDQDLEDEYNPRELQRLVRLGMACTRSNPDLRPTMRQIVSALDGNDRWLDEAIRKEKNEEWQGRNSDTLALIRRLQALGIQ